MSVKSAIKQRFPAALTAYHWLRMLPRRLVLRVLSREAVFERRYRQGGWENDESVSGVGSSKAVTRAIRRALPPLVQEIGARSFADIPCGDYNWMQDVELGVDRYVGADIVDPLVEENRKRFADDRHEFIKADIVRDDLPEVDIIFCRDCLVHLSYADIFEALRNIKRSGSRYLLTTTHTETAENEDILTGEFRSLDLRKAPFHFPEPVKLINEECAEKLDKCLGLWRVEDLPS